MAVVNKGVWLGRLRKEVRGGVVLLLAPAGETGDDGDRLRLFIEEDNESIGLKHWASGLNPLLAAWISLSKLSIDAALSLFE